MSKHTHAAVKRQKRPWLVKLLAMGMAALMIVLAIPLMWAGLALSRVNTVDSGPQREVEYTPPPEDSDSSEPTVHYDTPPPVEGLAVRGDSASLTNILVLGLENREGATYGRPDAVMILTIDRARGQLRLTSVMRDILVDIPRDSGSILDKFHHSYAYGGFTLMKKTLEQRFFIKIDKYVVVSFDAFTHIVDKMGGVNLTVTASESKMIDTLATFTGEARSLQLSGVQALEYARIRKIDDDFARSQRQKTVLTALFAKLKSQDKGQVVSLATDCAKYITTNLSQADILDMAAKTFTTYRGYALKTNYAFPNGVEDRDFIGGIISLRGERPFVWQIKDWKKSLTALHKYVFDGEE